MPASVSSSADETVPPYLKPSVTLSPSTPVSAEAVIVCTSPLYVTEAADEPSIDRVTFKGFF